MMEPKEDLYDWDDTEFFKAYKRLFEWKVGGFCRAVYSEDDLLYEAVILSIYEDSCTVEFLGYGDEEDVNLFTLKRSLGKLAREKQKKSACRYYQNTKSWKVGDFCRAVYSEDYLLYEAVILSIYEDSCTVEFLGYGDEEDVNLFTLKRSLGKFAREKQKKSACHYYQNTKSESENEETKPSYSKYSSNRKKQDEGNSTDVSSCFEDRKKKRHGSQMAKPNAASYGNGSFGTWGPHMPPVSYYAPSTPPTHSHIPCPPLPPIPQDPTFAHNPNLSAMMMAWYIAGYYTGLNTSQNHQSFQYNCGHGKQCCQHC